MIATHLRGVVSGTMVRALILGHFGQKLKMNKNISNYKWGDALDRRCLVSSRFYSAWASFFNVTGPVFLRQGYLGHRVCLSSKWKYQPPPVHPGPVCSS